jgi:predicted glycoside hydrolase/deacetylase ChbG (UPF0249 family)
VSGDRFLVVTADDFGIGPATSEGILDLAKEGLVTATVLLVTSPYAEEAVRAWRRAGEPLELGWHPCLTLDQPVLPAAAVPSLVGSDGRFWPLPSFLRRLLLGQVRTTEVQTELLAQYNRYHDLVGRPPTLVNAHHHVQVFPPVGAVLRTVLSRHSCLPYVRRVREPWQTLARVRGARAKRVLLTVLGRREAWRLVRAGFPGNDWLLGVTDPPWVTDPAFFARWIACCPGRVLELICHPGYLDRTLLGRDGTLQNRLLDRRVHELYRLREARFLESCCRAGIALTAPSALAHGQLP